MSDYLTFLTVDDVLAIHQRIIREFGGNPEVRDYGLLESAVAMPAARFGGELLHDDEAAMAGAYLFHICKNHAFVDGNKRTAVAAAEIFLLLNKRRLTASDDQLEHMTVAVAKGSTSKDETIAFFRKHIKKGKE